MLEEEQIRGLIFLGVVAALYALAVLWFASRALFLRILKKQAGPGDHLARLVLKGIAVLGVVCAVYARFVEPYWLDVSYVQLAWARWHGEPLRIVQLSDMHSDPVARLEERLPEVVRSKHPDLIVFTGDAINSLAGLDNFKHCMTELARIAPTVAVRGNWDVWYWASADLFGGTGVQEVANSSVAMPVRGNNVWIAGLSVGKEKALPELMKSAPSDSLRILLHHYPDQLLEASRLGVDLYLGGHTHGGQIALPFYGAVVTLSRFGKRFEAGMYREGETLAYINRGIGMEGGSAPRMRFFARPEVTVIDVLTE